MALKLTIENETSLPDGGPLSVQITGKRGLDIGRDRHLDWTLPDPTRTISAKHCEVRYQDGGYWLYDVSTNGTFLDGVEGRLKAPHKLKNGDRLLIGPYIIGVALDGDAPSAPPDAAASRPSSYQDFWNPTPDAAPPIDAALLRTPREAATPIRSDFLDWATDIPDVDGPAPPVPSVPPARETGAAKPSGNDLDWASGPAKPVPAPEPMPPVPSPRRPAPAAEESKDPSKDPWALPEGTAGPGYENVVASAPEPETMPAPQIAARQTPPAPRQAAPPQNPAERSPVASHADFVRLLAEGAAVPPQLLAHRSPEELAALVGAIVRLVTENVMQLLNARQHAKRVARSSTQTTVQAIDNNPLKFSPTAEDALRIMFGPPTSSYLDAHRALEQGFGDLKAHQVKTFAAMQQALAMLVEDLDPQAIDYSMSPDKGLSALVTSRKAKLWDTYVMRWQAKTRRYEGGLIDVFMQYFAECYDRMNDAR
jgi:type VI secretion system protein ImpI